MMHTRRLGIIILSLVSVSAFLFLHTFGISGTGIPMEFQTISKGDSTGVGGGAGKYCVIQNDEDWAQLWNEHQGGGYRPDLLPDVDFSEKTVIAVFMGLCVSTGYEIRVESIIDTGLSVAVRVGKWFDYGRPIAGIFTSPFHIVQVQKINKWIIFTTWTNI